MAISAGYSIACMKYDLLNTQDCFDLFKILFREACYSFGPFLCRHVQTNPPTSQYLPDHCGPWSTTVKYVRKSPQLQVG